MTDDVTVASKTSLERDLRALGVVAGDMLMVHASLRSAGPIAGGAATVVKALLSVLEAQGTLAAYADFEPFYDESTPDADVPVFDKQTARAALDHGVLHETIRTWPGAVRSDHPDAGVVAIGRLAEWLTADHPLQYGYGEGSPLEKLTMAGGRVLMLGAPLDTITLLHYAEHIADIPDKRIHRYRRRMPGNVWIDFEEFDTGDPVHEALPEMAFDEIARDYLKTGRGLTGKVAQADSYLFEAREVVAFGKDWIEKHVRSATST